MLSSLRLENLGPATVMEMELNPRLNVLTGDNGLGKTLLLDVAFWAVTGVWVGDGAPARPGQAVRLQVGSSWYGRMGPQIEGGQYGFLPANSPPLVVFAQVDGGFSVWDPVQDLGPDEYEFLDDVDLRTNLKSAWQRWRRQKPLVLSARDVVGGTSTAEGCFSGLKSDIAKWQREGGTSWDRITTALRVLSPEGEGLAVNTRGDSSYEASGPTFLLPYGQADYDQLSSGMRRMIALAYMLVWILETNEAKCAELGFAPQRQVLFLIDEVECHLHPKWQRLILRALVGLVDQLAAAEDGDAHVQIIATTHSPMVMTSIEPLFDEGLDAWYDLDLVYEDESAPQVQLLKRDFVRHGDARQWLLSEAFDMNSALSVEAEQAIGAAREFLLSEQSRVEEVASLEARLASVLAELDPFWRLWRHHLDKRGWLR